MILHVGFAICEERLTTEDAEVHRGKIRRNKIYLRR